MSKLKKAIQKEIKGLPEKEQAKAQKLLDKSIGKSGSGRISAKELDKFKKRGIGTKLTHPSNLDKDLGGGNSNNDAPGPPPSDYYFDPYSPVSPPPVRVPDRDVINLATTSIDAATITNLLFENIGANELTKFIRHDTVEGINPYYDIISNLSDIKRRFNPSELISLQKSDFSNFDIFPIKLQDKIPDEKYLEENDIPDYIFFAENGDLIIEVVNMLDSEIVEIQIDTNGTIYEIGESW